MNILGEQDVTVSVWCSVKFSSHKV